MRFSWSDVISSIPKWDALKKLSFFSVKIHVHFVTVSTPITNDTVGLDCSVGRWEEQNRQKGYVRRRFNPFGQKKCIINGLAESPDK